MAKQPNKKSLWNSEIIRDLRHWTTGQWNAVMEAYRCRKQEIAIPEILEAGESAHRFRPLDWLCSWADVFIKAIPLILALVAGIVALSLVLGVLVFLLRIVVIAALFLIGFFVIRYFLATPRGRSCR